LPPISTIGKDYLTGKKVENTRFNSTDFRNILPRFTPEGLKGNQSLVELLGDIAGWKKVMPAQVALAWLVTQKPWIVLISGATKQNRLEENPGAPPVELMAEDRGEIEIAASKIAVQGALLPQNLERMTDRWSA
jgi:aryl-alcohol dehydrogenase-like predicted oxidoreductase